MTKPTQRKEAPPRERVRMTTAEATVAALVAHDIDTIYALPGVHNDSLFDALFRAGDHIRTIHTRHEQGAAYMALGAALEAQAATTTILGTVTHRIYGPESIATVRRPSSTRTESEPMRLSEDTEKGDLSRSRESVVARLVCRVAFGEPMRGLVGVQERLQQTTGRRCFLNRDHPIADSGGQAGQGRGNVRWSSNFESFNLNEAPTTAGGYAFEDWEAIMRNSSRPGEATTGSPAFRTPPRRRRQPPPRKPATRTPLADHGAAEAEAGDPSYATETTPNRTPAETTANRGAAEAAASKAATKAGPDRSTTETTTTYRPAPKAAAD